MSGRNWRKGSVVLLLLLTMCAPTPPTVIDTGCSAFGPITYSPSQDTPETVEQIVRHNKVYRALCGGVLAYADSANQ